MDERKQELRWLLSGNLFSADGKIYMATKYEVVPVEKSNRGCDSLEERKWKSDTVAQIGTTGRCAKSKVVTKNQSVTKTGYFLSGKEEFNKSPARTPKASAIL